MLGLFWEITLIRSQEKTKDLNGFNTNDLVKIANMKMPYGKYKGTTLIDLPERYIVWP